MNDKINLIDKRAGEMMASDLLKTLVDEKSLKIIDLTKDEALTTKEISEKMNVKVSNLYYPIKKLLDIKALKIVEEKKIKNITEYYYSSKHLNKEGLNLDLTDLQENLDSIISFLILENRNLIDVMRNDMKKVEEYPQEEIKKMKEPNNMTFVNDEMTLSYEKWNDMMSEIRTVCRKYKNENKDEKGNTYTINIASYKR